MKTPLRSPTLILLALTASCGQPSPVGADANVDPNVDMGVADIPSPDGSDSTDDAPCEAGETRCEGVCVDLQADDENCGVCGFSCHEGYYHQGTDPFCFSGQCTPSIQGCLRDDSGFATCAEFCMSLGEECRGAEDEPNCTVPVELTATSFPEDCWDGPEYLTEVGCDDPIPYNFELGQLVFDVAHCCCTHSRNESLDTRDRSNPRRPRRLPRARRDIGR